MPCACICLQLGRGSRVEKERATRVAAIIPAAGKGKRMGAERPKQFLELKDKPILAFTLEAFEKAECISAVILVVPPQDVDLCVENVVKRYGLSKVVIVLAGGEKRQDSVRIGLEATGGRYDLVVIHDGVRPFVRPDFIESIVAVAQNRGAVIAGIPANDTIKEVDHGRRITKTWDRERLWLAQTPQVFQYSILQEAHQRAREQGWKDLTDDAQLVEKMGIPVYLMECSPLNIKVTTPADLLIARAIMEIWQKDED